MLFLGSSLAPARAEAPVLTEQQILKLLCQRWEDIASPSVEQFNRRIDEAQRRQRGRLTPSDEANMSFVMSMLALRDVFCKPSTSFPAPAK